MTMITVMIVLIVIVVVAVVFVVAVTLVLKVVAATLNHDESQKALNLFCVPLNLALWAQDCVHCQHLDPVPRRTRAAVFRCLALPRFRGFPKP